MIRRTLAAAALLLTLALAACGAPSTDTAPTTAPAPPTTPDGVAAAFAAEYAAGDTPAACTFAGGYAMEKMTRDGLCAHTQWPAVQYWPGRVCLFSTDDPYLSADNRGMQLFQFHTNGLVAGFPDFLVGVQQSGPTWRVTSVLPDTPSTGLMYQQCQLAAIGNPTTGPSS